MHGTLSARVSRLWLDAINRLIESTKRQIYIDGEEHSQSQPRTSARPFGAPKFQLVFHAVWVVSSQNRHWEKRVEYGLQLRGHFGVGRGKERRDKAQETLRSRRSGGKAWRENILPDNLQRRYACSGSGWPVLWPPMPPFISWTKPSRPRSPDSRGMQDSDTVCKTNFIRPSFSLATTFKSPSKLATV